MKRESKSSGDEVSDAMTERSSVEEEEDEEEEDDVEEEEENVSLLSSLDNDQLCLKYQQVTSRSF